MRVFVLLLFLGSSTLLSAQLFIQIEKRGSLKTERFYKGDLLLFQLEGEDGWFEETIEDIYVEENLVLFTNRIVPLDKIKAIRDINRYEFLKNLGNRLIVFSGVFFTYSLLATLAGWTLSIDTGIIGGSALVVGLVFKWLFKHKTWRIKGRKRLRALSLNPIPTA